MRHNAEQGKKIHFQKASSSNGRAAVSKTAGWGFESLLACQNLKPVFRREWKSDMSETGEIGKIEKGKRFLSEAKVELMKVVWPSKQQTLASTRIVIIFVAIITVFLGLCDFIFGKLVSLILS